MSQSPSGYVGAYSANQRGGETGREVDAYALLRCASRLEVARDPNCPHDVYIEAIRHNMRLWTIFQVSVTDPECPLPHNVRVDLFKLSRYVDKVSFAAIAKKDLDGIASLIQINRQIAAGLSAGAKMAPQPEVPPQSAEPIQITT